MADVEETDDPLGEVLRSIRSGLPLPNPDLGPNKSEEGIRSAEVYDPCVAWVHFREERNHREIELNGKINSRFLDEETVEVTSKHGGFDGMMDRPREKEIIDRALEVDVGNWPKFITGYTYVDRRAQKQFRVDFPYMYVRGGPR